ncbi:MAG: mannose-1-phosphate guanylyltransferase/mannose-6-phosphate isomerase, partial [Desulfobacterales bacterium]|nr:mannose-1-phosphate guanylyltransferase/mannose-6-phosphate isomerase [Desulfobacterales bacterium]
EQLRLEDMEAEAIILEPVGRNTAPAVAIAALAAEPDDVLLVLAADHVIADTEEFSAAVVKAAELADQGRLVTFGIVPESAQTGYGYIRRGEGIEGAQSAFLVDAFVEKPDQAMAESYIESGEYYWNSGMFAFRADRYLAELEQHNPQMLQACINAWKNAKDAYGFIWLDQAAFSGCVSDSIDYAVMEKTDSAAVIPLQVGWNDIGSWSALWDVSEKDGQENYIQGDVLMHDTQGCYIRAENKMVATVGLEDIVVVETDDAVLVAARDRVQEVKKITDQLKAENRSECESHRKVYRPWGWYDSVDVGERHQAKRIVVNPGAKLSLQKHHHRAEHWIVVKGTAKVQKGDEELVLSENESTYIPIGTVHSLENPGVISLEMIEVQTGSYLGEDDIVRFEDCYGRES